MFDLTETLAAATRNYEKIIPTRLHNLEFERSELDQVVRLTGKIPGSYNLATKQDLCFDSAVLYWHTLQKEHSLPEIRFAIARGMDHALLISPTAGGSVIVIDPSWKQFYAPFSEAAPELFKSLPEALILKDFFKVQNLIRALDAIFCPSVSCPPSEYYAAYDMDSPAYITQRLRAEEVLRRYEAVQLEKTRASYRVASTGMTMMGSAETAAESTPGSFS